VLQLVHLEGHRAAGPLHAVPVVILDQLDDLTVLLFPNFPPCSVDAIV